jgi:hypothetical protein
MEAPFYAQEELETGLMGKKQFPFTLFCLRSCLLQTLSKKRLLLVQIKLQAFHVHLVFLLIFSAYILNIDVREI